MLSAAEQACLARVSGFAQNRILPAAAGWSMGQNPDPALYTEAADLGLMGLEIPPEFGGQGFGFRLKAQVCAVLAAADFGFALSVINTHNVAVRLCESAPGPLRDRYLPALLSGQTSACTALTEPGTGSDFAAIRMTARSSKAGWVLQGEKTWIVNGRHAGLAIVFAQSRDPGEAAGIGAFLVDLTVPGSQSRAIDTAFSQTSTGTGGFVLENVTVPGDAMLLPPGMAFKPILTEINGARTYVAAMCNGMMRAALDEVTAYGQHRHSFGRPLMDHAAWAQVVHRAVADLKASEEQTEKAIARIEAGQGAQLVAAEAKIYAAQTCQQHIPQLLHAMGAEGLRPERCFTRHLAAAQVAGLTDGATSLLQDRVARLSGRTADQKKEKS